MAKEISHFCNLREQLKAHTKIYLVVPHPPSPFLICTFMLISRGPVIMSIIKKILLITKKPEITIHYYYVQRIYGLHSGTTAWLLWNITSLQANPSVYRLGPENNNSQCPALGESQIEKKKLCNYYGTLFRFASLIAVSPLTVPPPPTCWKSLGQGQATFVTCSFVFPSKVVVVPPSYKESLGFDFKQVNHRPHWKFLWFSLLSFRRMLG
jgi:hypothetical protein